MNRLTAVAILVLVGLTGAMSAARADDPAHKPHKASSFAPHHTGKRVYGAPIGPQILHSRKHKPAAHGIDSRPSAAASHVPASQP